MPSPTKLVAKICPYPDFDSAHPGFSARAVAGTRSAIRMTRGRIRDASISPLRAVDAHLRLRSQERELPARRADVVAAPPADEAGVSGVDEDLLEREHSGQARR